MKQKYFIKICGITNVEDALYCVEAGATAIGLNFYRGSKRYVDMTTARSVADAVRGKIAIVGVFVNEELHNVKQIASDIKLTYCQFSGDEVPEMVNTFGNAIKVFHIDDSLHNLQFGDYETKIFLLDSNVNNGYGGTGTTFNWLLAREGNEFGRIIIAGGLTPDNVSGAIQTAQPWGVDVSSGVEREPGKKDHEKVRQFVFNAISAFTM